MKVDMVIHSRTSKSVSEGEMKGMAYCCFLAFYIKIFIFFLIFSRFYTFFMFQMILSGRGGAGTMGEEKDCSRRSWWRQCGRCKRRGGK